MRIASVLCCLLLVAGPAFAQNEEPGWRINATLQGTFNEAGQILKTEPTLGYAFNRYFEIYAGLPVYFVRSSTRPLEGGLGNAVLGLVMDLDNPVLHFNSSLVTTAPTGSRERGFSTGHVTADWTNTFSRRFSTFVPYASLGVANTVSDTSFFVRPFSSDGLVAHFEAGAVYGLSPVFSTGASVYSVRARGEQQIIVRERQGPGVGNPTRVIRNEAHDSGAAIWLSMQPRGRLHYMAGYSHSSGYGLDSLFFGIGLRVK